METMNYSGVFAVETCCNCHIRFAMPEELQNQRQTQGGSFYCPNGHGQHYTTTENARLRERLDQANKDAQYWRQRKIDADAETEHTRRQLAAQKGQLTKVKNRIQKGVCPCCNRSFENLRRHMASKHPDFVPEKS